MEFSFHTFTSLNLLQSNCGIRDRAYFENSERSKNCSVSPDKTVSTRSVSIESSVATSLASACCLSVLSLQDTAITIKNRRITINGFIKDCWSFKLHIIMQVQRGFKIV